jgi:hypothetical protein
LFFGSCIRQENLTEYDLHFLKDHMWNDIFTFDPGPPVSEVKIGLVLLLVVILFALFFVFPVIKKRTSNKALKKIVAKSRGGLMGYALGMIVLLWLRFETVPFLSMRLWFYLLLLSFVGWVVWKINAYLKIKKRIESAEARRKRK